MLCNNGCMKVPQCHVTRALRPFLRFAVDGVTDSPG